MEYSRDVDNPECMYSKIFLQVPVKNNSKTKLINTASYTGLFKTRNQVQMMNSITQR